METEPTTYYVYSRSLVPLRHYWLYYYYCQHIIINKKPLCFIFLLYSKLIIAKCDNYNLNNEVKCCLKSISNGNYPLMSDTRRPLSLAISYTSISVLGNKRGGGPISHLELKQLIVAKHIVILTSYYDYTEASRGAKCDCKTDWLWVRSPLEEV